MVPFEDEHARSLLRAEILVRCQGAARVVQAIQTAEHLQVRVRLRALLVVVQGVFTCAAQVLSPGVQGKNTLLDGKHAWAMYRGQHGGSFCWLEPVDRAANAHWPKGRAQEGQAHASELYYPKPHNHRTSCNAPLKLQTVSSIMPGR